MSYSATYRISLASTPARDRERILEALAALSPAPDGAQPGAEPPAEFAPCVEDDVLLVPHARAMETYQALSASDDLRALAVAFRLLEEIERHEAAQPRSEGGPEAPDAVADALEDRCPRPPEPGAADLESLRTMTRVASSAQGAPSPNPAA
jgi:hypothetical protein